MHKLDIVEAILSPQTVPNPNEFQIGQVIMTLTRSSAPSRMSVPLILRDRQGDPNNYSTATPFAVGFSKEEVLRRATQAIDRMFDLLKEDGYTEFICKKCGNRFLAIDDHVPNCQAPTGYFKKRSDRFDGTLELCKGTAKPFNEETQEAPNLLRFAPKDE